MFHFCCIWCRPEFLLLGVCLYSGTGLLALSPLTICLSFSFIFWKIFFLDMGFWVDSYSSMIKISSGLYDFQ